MADMDCWPSVVSRLCNWAGTYATGPGLTMEIGTVRSNENTVSTAFRAVLSGHSKLVVLHAARILLDYWRSGPGSGSAPSELFVQEMVIDDSATGE